MPVNPEIPLDKSSWEKQYLRAIFLSQLEAGSVEVSKLAEEVEKPLDSVQAALRELVEKSYVVPYQSVRSPRLNEEKASVGPESTKYVLSERGRERFVVVMTGGVFDILHVGHLSSFEEARGLGDLLVVVVARDSTVKRLKHRAPINPELQRVRLVNALSIVDVAVLGDEYNFLNSVEKIRPDIIAVGYDQKHDTAQLRNDLDLRGIPSKVIRLKSHVPGIKSSRILSRIHDINSLD